jgi:hypothetical protein
MDEREPVDDGEFVYRRIHPKFYKPAAPVSVLYEAFRPSKSDDAGLSVVRACFAKPEDCLLGIDPASVGGYAVARLSVRDLRCLGLTVRPDPVATGPRGHAIIPELAGMSTRHIKSAASRSCMNLPDSPARTLSIGKASLMVLRNERTRGL